VISRIGYQIDRAIAEQTPLAFGFILKKPDLASATWPPPLVPVTLAEIATATLTLYDVASDAILNSLDDADIKNAGRGTIGATDGRVVIALHDADNPIQGAGAVGALETHTALVEIAYNGGLDTYRVEVSFAVKNLEKVP